MPVCCRQCLKIKTKIRDHLADHWGGGGGITRGRTTWESPTSRRTTWRRGSRWRRLPPNAANRKNKQPHWHLWWRLSQGQEVSDGVWPSMNDKLKPPKHEGTQVKGSLCPKLHQRWQYGQMEPGICGSVGRPSLYQWSWPKQWMTLGWLCPCLCLTILGHQKERKGLGPTPQYWNKGRQPE